MKLDKQKPFGIVSGEDLVRFEQGGKMFDADEEEIVIEDEAKSKKEAKPGKPAKEKEPESVAKVDPEAKQPGDDQLSAQIGQ